MAARSLGRELLHWTQRVGPVVLSAGLVAWLVWKVTPAKLVQAAQSPALPWLVLATLVQLVVLIVWDTVTMWWLFTLPDRRIPFRTVLRARTDSIVWSAFNLEIGQGMFAWHLADAGVLPVTDALARSVVLGIFDFGTLMSVALVGSFVYDHPLIGYLRWIPIGCLSGLIVLIVAFQFLPEAWRNWLEEKSWGSWLTWWSWRHSILLALQRFVLFALVLVYAGVCLAIIHIGGNVRTVVGVIPFVLLAESIPGTAGLGERETALIYLLEPANADERALLLAFGLTWSLVIIFGRLAIGLVSRWLPHRSSPEAVRTDSAQDQSPRPSGAAC